MAEERQVTVDMERFEECRQKARSTTLVKNPEETSRTTKDGG